MQPEDDSWRAHSDLADDASSPDGGADSSNRPWETDSLLIAVAARPPVLGLIAIAAAVLLSLADVALLYSPDAGYGFGDTQHLAGVPRWRLLLGHYVGVLLLPAYIPGYWLVCRGLGKAGPWRSWPVFALGAYATAIAGARHAQLALLALIARHAGADSAAPDRLIESARAFADPLHGLVYLLFALASLGFAVAVLAGPSRFPRRLAAFNPLLLGLLFALPHLLAPSLGPARMVAAAAPNLGHLVFFALVTTAMHRAPAGA